MRAQLRFQACDEEECYFPEQFDFELPINYPGSRQVSALRLEIRLALTHDLAKVKLQAGLAWRSSIAAHIQDETGPRGPE